MLKIFLSGAVGEGVAFHTGEVGEQWLGLCEMSPVMRLNDHKDSRVVLPDKDKTGRDIKTSQISPAFSDGISQSCASDKAECFAFGIY